MLYGRTGRAFAETRGVTAFGSDDFEDFVDFDFVNGEPSTVDAAIAVFVFRFRLMRSVAMGRYLW